MKTKQTQTKQDLTYTNKPHKVMSEPHLYGFQNGVFSTETNKFYYYNETSHKHHISELHETSEAAQYTDQIFDEAAMSEECNSVENFMAIKLGPIHSIMKTQNFTNDECIWIFALLGRMLNPIGAKDNWCVSPYFLGVSGAGRSILLRLLAALLNSEDVGYLCSESIMTLATGNDKRIILGMDMGENPAIDQANFYCMVEGESFPIPRLYKTPISVTWDAHCAFVGSKLPTWAASKSAWRRIVAVKFDKPVLKHNPQLFAECLQYKDRFLKVITSAYHHILETFGNSRGIKESMPETLRQ